MKKVYETTREFEYAVNKMLGGIAPPEDLSEFFSIFEEARYSDHEIGADQRDRAIAALQTLSLIYPNHWERACSAEYAPRA